MLLRRMLLRNLANAAASIHLQQMVSMLLHRMLLRRRSSICQIIIIY
jgi:hypothetical protein